MRCSMNHTVDCFTPMSRGGFMLETDMSNMRHRQIAMAHSRIGTSDRTGAHLEVGSALREPIKHRPRVRNLARAGRLTLAAMPFAVRPSNRFKPRRSIILGLEHVRKFDQGNAFAVRFSGCFSHHLQSPFLMTGI